MKLLKYEGYQIVIEPEFLTLKPFKTIWSRDRSKNKDNAIAEIAYIYFFCDIRSDYQYIIDLDKRASVIKEDQGLPSKWKPDKVLIEAMKFYSSFKTSAAILLDSTRIAVDKLSNLLTSIDLDARDDKGKPIYTLNTITSTIKQIPMLVKDLEEAEKALSKEIGIDSKMRGQGEKTIFEDGFK